MKKGGECLFLAAIRGMLASFLSGTNERDRQGCILYTYIPVSFV
jgi:hypothetical protein